MTKSMTGFAAVEMAAGEHRVSWELRSVNHRFLDISLRLPEDLKRLDSDCRNLIREGVGRGKVDATLKFTLSPGVPTDWRLNEATLDRLERLTQDVKDRFASIIEVLALVRTLQCYVYREWAVYAFHRRLDIPAAILQPFTVTRGFVTAFPPPVIQIPSGRRIW